MPIHWTYRIPKPEEDLSQGDIIARDESVLNILKGVHDYFRDPKYLCFIVLTQSCDLVMRSGACKARQIGLGVVRSLDEVLADVFGETCGAGAARVYSRAGRADAKELVERVLNQNEWGHGYFYLHPHADVKIAVEAVAVLRVSIALRSREHYETLRGARCGSLDTEYRNKLGWLTGNLYSRVDTTDWADQPGGKAGSKKLVDKLLDGEGEGKNIWIPEPLLQVARDKQIDLTSIPREAILATLQKDAPPTPQAIALGCVREKANQVLGEVNEKQADRLVELVKDDLVCPLLAAQEALACVREVFMGIWPQAAVLLTAAPGDQRWSASLVAQVGEAVGKFKVLRGGRTVPALIGLLQETQLFAGPAIDCTCEVVRQAIGEDVDAKKPELVERLRAAKMTAPMLAHIHGLIRQAGDEVLGEKLSNRLRNDRPFNGTLKSV